MNRSRNTPATFIATALFQLIERDLHFRVVGITHRDRAPDPSVLGEESRAALIAVRARRAGERLPGEGSSEMPFRAGLLVHDVAQGERCMDDADALPAGEANAREPTSRRTDPDVQVFPIVTQQ